MEFLQLLFHFWGDYILQSDWMATDKTKSSFPAFAHASVYSLPFVFLAHSVEAMLVILLSHFLIDRFRLARFVVYAKNFVFAPPFAYLEKSCGKICDSCRWVLVDKYRWENCKLTGYSKEVPPFLAFWLMIITDNILHVTINYLSIKYL